MDTGDIVSLVALVISIIAFAATMMQVAQQYYASAAGYANCGEQVIGEWSTTKRRRFLLNELRFEVQFEAPVIFVCSPTNTKGPVKGQGLIFISGTKESMEESMVLSRRLQKQQDSMILSTQLQKQQDDELSDDDGVHTADNERATWTLLLSTLHTMERESEKWQQAQRKGEERNAGPNAAKIPPLATWNDFSTVVALQRKLKSWDTMPSEVKKPYATTTICHIIEMAAMMGLHWKQFDRSNHRYHAEGNGYLLTGHDVADLGTMFSFQKYGKPQFRQNRVMPVEGVKELAFGNVPTIYPRSRVAKDRTLESDGEDTKAAWVLQFGSEQELAETLIHFGCNTKTADYFRDPKKKHGHLFPLPFEVLGMLAKPMYIPNTYFRTLPNPTTFEWNRKNFSLYKLLLEYNKALMNEDIAPAIQQLSWLQNSGAMVETALEDRRPKDDEHFPLALLAALYQAIVNCDKFLLNEVRQDLVVLVIREHIQELMKLLNEGDAAEGASPSGNLKDAASHSCFDDLNSAGPEEKQSKFMDIYFSTVLPHVQRNTREVLRKRRSTQYVHSPRRSMASSTHLPLPEVGSNGSTDNEKNPAVAAETDAEDMQTTTPGLSIGEGRKQLKQVHAGLDDTQAGNIWCILVFRMLCWLLLHDFHKKDVQISKSELYGSRLRVYVA